MDLRRLNALCQMTLAPPSIHYPIQRCCLPESFTHRPIVATSNEDCHIVLSLFFSPISISFMTEFPVSSADVIAGGRVGIFSKFTIQLLNQNQAMTSKALRKLGVLGTALR